VLLLGAGWSGDICRRCSYALSARIIVMRKARLVVFGAEAVGAVIVAGVFLWLHYNPATPLDNSNGGTVQISAGSSGQGQSSTVLNDQTQLGNGSQSGSIPMNASSGGSNSSSSGSGSTANSASASAPTAAELTQYESYAASKTAMFIDVAIGTGSTVAAGSTVIINYRGWLTNGKEFDDSYARGKPFTFVVGKNQVITGLEEGIVGMKEGGQRRIIVPASVGYGAKAAGPVPANSLLVIDVSLLAVQ
jgi:FKBP-type peptidyl-prolyl cis-trans isomerase